MCGSDRRPLLYHWRCVALLMSLLHMADIGTGILAVSAKGCQTPRLRIQAVSFLCSTEVIAGSVDGTVRRFDIRAGMLYTDNLGQVRSLLVNHV